MTLAVRRMRRSEAGWQPGLSRTTALDLQSWRKSFKRAQTLESPRLPCHKHAAQEWCPGQEGYGDVDTAS